ncbi:hypothetical protein CO614_04410 [Lysobacteraceae bacterium NML120232]|nr:hypothetical protein CO614_04410 [Xanthomonadaceae bacterium NML120232]
MPGFFFLHLLATGRAAFWGRKDWALEHKHATFNRLLQSLRAPDFVNVAFGVHDIRRRRRIGSKARFRQSFNTVQQKASRTSSRRVCRYCPSTSSLKNPAEVPSTHDRNRAGIACLRPVRARCHRAALPMRQSSSTA